MDVTAISQICKFNVHFFTTRKLVIHIRVQLFHGGFLSTDERKEGTSVGEAKLCGLKYQKAEDRATDLLENINFYNNLSNIGMSQCLRLCT